MRYYENSTIQLSDDVSNLPNQIRFGETVEVTDITSLTKSHTIVDRFVVGTTAVNMGQISAGKFLYIKPAVNCQIQIGSATLDLLGGKPSKLWISFTAISIIIPNVTLNVATPPLVTIVIGG